MLSVAYIQLENFKSFENIKIYLNEKLSVIIGENNIGKSSVFEAIFLWKACYDLAIDAKGSGFYKMSDKARRYISFGDLSFIRINEDKDLFLKTPLVMKISLGVKIDEYVYDLGFEISIPQYIKNSYLRVEQVDSSQFVAFATKIKSVPNINLRTAIFVYQTHPLSGINRNEFLYNEGQVLHHINTGNSSEVLRNKIHISLNSPNAERFKNMVSSVLGEEIDFKIANKNIKKDKFLRINVSINGNEKELHLQGSGILQIAEIFSTLDFITYYNAVNLFLIDEPDSHIHTTIQNRLLDEIKKISNVQSIIISHNDTFVGNLREGELFFLNHSCKSSHELRPLQIVSFDDVKRELGGIIIALERLNKTEMICFVEGDDDIKYITSLLNKYCDVAIKKVKKSPVFLHLRGKGEFKSKTAHNKWILHQINPVLLYGAIFDKDFSTENKNNEFKINVCNGLGRGSLQNIFTHDGYCIESVLFSDIERLNRFLAKISRITLGEVQSFTSSYINTLITEMRNPNSGKYNDMKSRFESQKAQGDLRPEMKDVQFIDFVGEAINKPQYFFHKEEIKKFVEEFDAHFSLDITHAAHDVATTKEDYSSRLYNLQISNIETLEDLYQSQSDMLNLYFKFE